VDRIDQLVAAFEARRDPDRAGPMAAYMKDHFPFLLRKHAKTDPDGVRAFVAAHEDALSPLSKREALRRLG
jgi:DNA alkylation repair enzyme